MSSTCDRAAAIPTFLSPARSRLRGDQRGRDLPPLHDLGDLVGEEETKTPLRLREDDVRAQDGTNFDEPLGAKLSAGHGWFDVALR